MNATALLIVLAAAVGWMAGWSLVGLLTGPARHAEPEFPDWPPGEPVVLRRIESQDGDNEVRAWG